jgi:hypothetical protein
MGIKRSIITDFSSGTPSSTYSVATGYSVGSEWINTNNGNRFYHKTDGNWVPLNVESISYIPGSNTGINITYGSTNSTIDTTYNTLLDPTLTMPSTVGGIPFGTTAGALINRNYNQLFDDLLFPTVNPTYTIPTISLSSTITGIREIGSTMSPIITITGTENDASYFSQLVIRKSVNSGTVSTLSTVSATSSMTVTSVTSIPNQFGYTNSNNPNFSYTISTTDSGLVVPAPPITGGSSTIVYSGLGDYTAGLAKKNNKGVTHSATSVVRTTTAPQAAATNFVPNTQTITGYYPIFYGKTSQGTVNALPKTVGEIADIIQSGTGFTKLVTDGSVPIVMTFSATGEWPWFAIYSSFASKTTWFNTSLNSGNIGNPNDLFSSPSIIAVTSSNGYWAVNYKIYIASKYTDLPTATIT